MSSVTGPPKEMLTQKVASGMVAGKPHSGNCTQIQGRIRCQATTGPQLAPKGDAHSPIVFTTVQVFVV